MRKTLFIVLLIVVGVSAGIGIQRYEPARLASDTNDFETCSLPLLQLDSLSGDEINEVSLIVGHAYGNPSNAAQGKVAASLTDFLIRQNNTFETIYFTGDILPSPSVAWFSELKENLSPYAGGIYAVPGNHDTGFNPASDHSAFEQSFDSNYPIVISKERSNFLLIDTIEHPWTITPDAIDIARQNSAAADTLFILGHSILRPDPKEIANSLDGIPDPLPDNLALIAQLKDVYEKITVISGDTGAFGNKPAVECRTYQGVTFVSQGLGVAEALILAIRDDALFALPLSF